MRVFANDFFAILTDCDVCLVPWRLESLCLYLSQLPIPMFSENKSAHLPTGISKRNLQNRKFTIHPQTSTVYAKICKYFVLFVHHWNAEENMIFIKVV